MEEDNLILCTDWEVVEEDDFYLTDKWAKEMDYDKEVMKEAREMAKNKKLYCGYIVDAKKYAIYYQLDASQVLINNDMDIIINCESSVIYNDMKKVISYEL